MFEPRHPRTYKATRGVAGRPCGINGLLYEQFGATSTNLQTLHRQRRATRHYEVELLRRMTEAGTYTLGRHTYPTSIQVTAFRPAHIKLVALLHHPSDVTAPIASIANQQSFRSGDPSTLSSCEALEELALVRNRTAISIASRNFAYPCCSSQARVQWFISGFDKLCSVSWMVTRHPFPTRTLPATPQ